MENLLYEYFRDKDEKITISRSSAMAVQPHFHRNVEVLYILSGSVSTKVGDEQFTAEEGDIIFVHNYSVHSFNNVHTKYFLILPPYYAQDIDKKLSKSTLPPYLSDKEFNKTLLPIFEKIYDEFDTMPSLVKKGYLNVLFGSLLAHYPSVPVEKPADIDFIVKVLHYVEEHYSDPITLDSISSVFGYNKYYFSRIFNRCVGENLSSYVNTVRLRYFMKQMKAEASPRISKVALASGFESIPTFYRCFTRAYGISPKEYFGSTNG